MAAGDDVKKEIETFQKQSLKDVETNEKNVLPDAEGTKRFWVDPRNPKLIIPN